MSAFLAALGVGTSVGSAIIDYNQKKKQSDREWAIYNQQRGDQFDFAKHGISWKVNDARRSGINPLAALGANTLSYSPVQVGGGSTANMAAHGQNISRAILYREAEGRGIDNQIKKATLQNMQLRNKALADTLNGQADPVKEVPNEVPMMTSHSVAGGGYPINQVAFDDQGRGYLIPGQNAAEMIGDEAPIVDRIGYTLNRLKDAVSDFKSTFNPNSREAKEVFSRLRRTRQTMNEARKLPNDMEYRFNLWSRTWIPKKRINGHSQLFDHHSLYKIK